jgi:uncharacterized protein YqjF (DUF2071 family)
MDITLSTTLKHLSLITWDVDPTQLQRLLPPQLIPATVPSPAGPRALFSMALMLEAGLAPKSMPWLSLYFAQLNERAYVTRPDGSGFGVYFWRSYVSSPSFIAPRWGLGLPYFWKRMRLEVKEQTLILSSKTEHFAALDLATNTQHTLLNGPSPKTVCDLIANPMIGYSILRQKRLASFTVEHPPITPRMVSIRHVDPSLMIAAPTLTPGQAPVVACYQAESPFLIHLPPRNIS